MLKHALKSHDGYEEKKLFSATVVCVGRMDCCARRMDCCARRNNNMFQEGPASGSCVEANRVQTVLAAWAARGAKCNASVCFFFFFLFLRCIKGNDFFLCVCNLVKPKEETFRNFRG